MKVQAIVETFFEFDFEDEGVKVFYRKNDDHLLVMDNYHGIPVVITNAEVGVDEDGNVETRLFEADSERDPVVNTIDDSIIVDINVYKKVL